MSYHESLDFEDLIGKTVNNAFVNDAKDFVLLETNNGDYYLTWVGDCCANCFLAHFNGADILVGSTIMEVRNNDWTISSSEDDYETIETMGTTMKTSKGYVDFESRVEHNGYYCGWINISKECPIGQYGNNDPEFNKYIKPLKDF